MKRGAAIKVKNGKGHAFPGKKLQKQNVGRKKGEAPIERWLRWATSAGDESAESGLAINPPIALGPGCELYLLVYILWNAVCVLG